MKKLIALTVVVLSSAYMLTALVSGCAGKPPVGAAEAAIDDETLVARVINALGESPEYKLNRVSVQTSGGIVQLGGFVSTPDQKGKASQIARRVAGVKRVENDIAIKADQSPVP